MSVFPARAGMSRIIDGLDYDKGGVPRASGDEPRTSDMPPLRDVCSPRERG